jgi:hypothetical protein
MDRNECPPSSKKLSSSDARDPEHLGPDVGQLLLDRCRGAGKGRLSSVCDSFICRRGPIDLAVRQARQRFDPHERRRDHAAAASAQVFPQLAVRRRRRSVAADERELRVAGIRLLATATASPIDGARQRRFDLELDPAARALTC